jgi:7-cyano-7-deazaguanine synthase
MASALSLGLAHRIDVDAPFASLEKSEVIRRGVTLGVPFVWTLSCMNPQAGAETIRHCGACSKCRERHDAFVLADVADPTEYRTTANISG